MSFLAPLTGLIAAAIAVPALVALYFLKLRRRQIDVPSTLLWKRAVQDLQVNAPFQRIRRNLLLWLQLIVLAGLLLAMARPTFRADVQGGRRVAIIIDHSASMNATDASGDGSRLDAAKKAALDLLDSLELTSGGGAMIVNFAEQARPVQSFTTEVARLRDAVRSIEPTDQRSRLEQALQLIEPEGTEVVYVLSDGRIHDAHRLAWRGGELRYMQIGSRDPTMIDNVALVALSAQRDYQKPHRVQVFARVANYGQSPVQANVSLLVDGQPVRVTPVDIPGTPLNQAEAGTKGLQFDLVVPDAALIEMRHDRKDMLAADDRAALVLEPARRLRVLLVTEGNAFLERVIEAIGVQERVNMDPRKFENQDPLKLRRLGWSHEAEREEGFDLIVFDGYAPTQTPLGPTLSFGSAPPIEGLSIVPYVESAPKTQALLDWRRDHPLMHRVVLDDVLVQEPGRIVMPLSGSVLATAQTGPILAEVVDHGVRHVVASFNVLQSNWPFYVSFPVFVQNAVNYLGSVSGGSDRLNAGLAFTPGSVAVVPINDGSGRVVTWRGPVELAASVQDGVAVVPMFTRAGIYEGTSRQTPPWDRVAVNLLDAVESDLRPASQLQVGTAPVTGQSHTASIRREVWTWFAWAALGMLMVEWLVYTRRMHL